MSTSIEELAERVAYLEREMRRTTHTIDGVEKRTDTSLREINTHLDRQDKNLQDFKESVDKRFEHIYAQLADINANTSDIRNILASLVKRLENGV